jgi:hypothetical protein
MQLLSLEVVSEITELMNSDSLSYPILDLPGIYLFWIQLPYCVKFKKISLSGHMEEDQHILSESPSWVFSQ